MTVKVSKRDGVVTIELGDRFDYDAVIDFRDAYTSYTGNSYVIDFRSTEYMDSSGLGMLLNMRRHINNDATNIRLINTRPMVRKVLAISRFDSKFEIV